MGEVCRDGDGVGWVALYRPSEQEFAAVVREFDLPERSVDDAVHAHQRPKLERYGETLFCVLRAARYIDGAETVEFSELHVFAAGVAPIPRVAARSAAPRPGGYPARDH